MSKLQRPLLFSEHFGVEANHLVREGAFNPILNLDTPLFIDPTLLEKSTVGQMRRAFTRYLRWFSNLGRILAQCQYPNDAYWKRALALLRFPEPPATCLGHTAEGIDGKGVGERLARQLVQAAYALVKAGAAEPRHMTGMPFLYKGFGPDRISDMTTRIILPELADFTQGVLKGLNLPRVPVRIESELHYLPVYETQPVILVPLKVLSEIPAACDIGSIARSVGTDSELRRRVSEHLEGAITIGADGWLGDLISAAVQGNKAAVAAFYDLLIAAQEPYDTDLDPAGYLVWRQGLGISSKHPMNRDEGATPQARAGQIVEKFGDLLYDPQISRCLYRGMSGTDVRPVRSLRLLFFAIAQSYCGAISALTVEYDTETELTTFLWRGVPVVRIDVSSSRQSNLKARYETGPHVDRLFVVVDFGDNKGDEIIAIMNARRSQGEPASDVEVIEV